jgi:hypothetical protein
MIVDVSKPFLKMGQLQSNGQAQVEYDPLKNDGGHLQRAVEAYLKYRIQFKEWSFK